MMSASLSYCDVFPEVCYLMVWERTITFKVIEKHICTQQLLNVNKEFTVYKLQLDTCFFCSSLVFKSWQRQSKTASPQIAL